MRETRYKIMHQTHEGYTSKLMYRDGYHTPESAMSMVVTMEAAGIKRLSIEPYEIDVVPYEVESPTEFQVTLGSINFI